MSLTHDMNTVVPLVQQCYMLCQGKQQPLVKMCHIHMGKPQPQEYTAAEHTQSQVSCAECLPANQQGNNMPG